MKLYAIYEGDIWLSRNSLICLGVFDTKQKAVSAIVENLQDYEDTLFERVVADAKEQLENDGQTHLFCCKTNYMIKEITLNRFGGI